MTGPTIIDRSRCAQPVVRPGPLACGEPATVIAPTDSDWTWAYCPACAQKKAEMLELEIRMDLANQAMGYTTETWKRTKLEALRVALEVA